MVIGEKPALSKHWARRTGEEAGLGASTSYRQAQARRAWKGTE
jgi:hypothetical protein